MSIRPFRDIKRKKTKVISVGNVKIGGDNPISVQSMITPKLQILNLLSSKLIKFMKKEQTL